MMTEVKGLSDLLLNGYLKKYIYTTVFISSFIQCYIFFNKLKKYYFSKCRVNNVVNALFNNNVFKLLGSLEIIWIFRSNPVIN